MKTLLTFLSLFIATTPLLAQVDYDSQIQTIFDARCTSCHGAGQNGFNSSSYDAVMNSSSPSNRYDGPYVIAGDADNSPLVDKIEANPQFGSRMPNVNGLPDEQIALIRQWIDEGANEVATNSEVDPDTPDQFRILGNYPNPFNPSTTVQFIVPESATYSISVYTVHGKLIMEQTGRVAAGLADVNLDLANNPTGLYIYRISAQLANSSRILTDSGRMTLIK